MVFLDRKRVSYVGFRKDLNIKFEPSNYMSQTQLS